MAGISTRGPGSIDYVATKPRKRRDILSAMFSTASFFLLLVIFLPLASTVAGTSVSDVLSAAQDDEVINSLILTFSSGAIATFFGLITGVPLSYLLARRRFFGKNLVEALIDLPVVIPHTAAGVAVLLVFGAQGILGRPLGLLGISFVDSIPGIVVAMIFVSTPFLITTVREAFRAVDPEMERMAESLGARSWQAFVYITLPLAWRGITAGALMMWARGISEFGAVVIIAYHPKIMPVLVFERFQAFGLNAALPAAVILIIASVLVFALLRIGFHKVTL